GGFYRVLVLDVQRERQKPSPSEPNTLTSVCASRLAAATGYPSSSSFLTSAWPSPFEQPVTNQTFLLVIFFLSFPNQILHIRMVPGVFLAIEQFPVVFQFLIQNSQTAFHLLHFLQGPLPLCLHDLIAFCKRSVALLIEGAARGRFVLPADFLQTFSMDF